MQTGIVPRGTFLTQTGAVCTGNMSIGEPPGCYYMKVTAQLTLEFDYPLSAWVLQHGGWLPLQFPGVDIILVDRNVTSTIFALTEHPDRTDMAPQKWWLENLNRSNIWINPILCAFEGKLKRTPTFEEFRTELVAVTSVLRRGLPQARLIEHSIESHPQLYQNVLDGVAKQQREAAFLRQACPLVAQRVSKSKAPMVERQLIDAAASTGVALPSFLFFAVLSVLYEPNTGQQPMIGRGVVKPSQDYSDEMAYNALADLRSLEYLAAITGFPGPKPGLCTRDKFLAALWVNMGVHNARWIENAVSMNIRPTEQLLPRLTPTEIGRLLDRLGASRANPC